MDIGFLKDLIYNICLLLGVGVVYSEISLKNTGNTRNRNLLAGCIVGLVGIAVMLNPWTLRPGLVFDVRSILLSVAGVFLSPVSAVIAASITALFRLKMGGIGALVGVCVIACSTAIGMLWRHFRPKIAVNPGLAELALFGLTVHLAMLGCMLLLPREIMLETIRRVSLPILAIYPAVTVLFTLLLLRNGERARNRRELAESEERYRAVSEYSNNAIWGWVKKFC